MSYMKELPEINAYVSKIKKQRIKERPKETAVPNTFFLGIISPMYCASAII